MDQKALIDIFLTAPWIGTRVTQQGLQLHGISVGQQFMHRQRDRAIGQGSDFELAKQEPAEAGNSTLLTARVNADHRP